MRYDWTKLTDGWGRQEACQGIAKVCDECRFTLTDSGSLFVDPFHPPLAPEFILKLLTEAIAQRKQCTVDDRVERALEVLRIEGGFPRAVEAGTTIFTGYHHLTASGYQGHTAEQLEAIAKAVRILQEEL